jgi:hypothetical protein
MRSFSVDQEGEDRMRKKGKNKPSMDIRCLGSLILLSLFLSALAYSGEKFQASADFTLGFPRGAFNENIGHSGLGGSGYFGFKFKKSPFSIGLSFSVLVLGSQTRVESFSSAIPDVEVDVTTRNYILMAHLVLRIQPPAGGLRPYAEGLLGFSYLWTETGVYDRGWGNSAIASSVNQSDFTWSAGAGGGLMIRIYEKKTNRGKAGFGIFIDVGARYVLGGRAEYLSEGGIIEGGGRLVYDTHLSRTDLLTTKIGLSFVF